MAIRLPSPLSEALEAIVSRIIGVAIEVHTRLGPGLGEGQYEDAMTIELKEAQLRFDRQRTVTIKYRDQPLRPQRIDLVVEDQVIVEIKAVERLSSVHQAQVISYLRATGLHVGLLINFNGTAIQGNFKRVVL